ncbi:helix-turn-helix domain-containing protein [Listeria ivanovii subsp. londoniensis]|uniref:helix-turn-helix domain-containing protein n=1 Tax=Listeria ivanovii TaxID=1638 RepID=UPI0019059BD3|nr:helix-turn-helix domain-containing protein [Listeria ivanovii]MBK1994973.1 helix-turn-helix domain-containing protein [Listeria ivanovii subsp. londoniensis]
MGNIDKKLIKKDYLAGMKNKEIVEKYGISPNTLKAWIRRYGWRDEKEEGAPKVKKQGAPFGNKNAKGNSGGGAPKDNKNAIGNSGGGAPLKNKNALFTGEFETIEPDYFSEDEKNIYNTLTDHPLAHANNIIKDEYIRKRRMMLRLNELENNLTDYEKEIKKAYQLQETQKVIEKDGQKVIMNIPEMVLVEQKEETKRKIDDVLRMEESITRQNGVLLRALRDKSAIIAQLSMLPLNQEKTQKEIDILELEIQDLKGFDVDKSLEIRVSRAVKNNG